MPDEWKWRRREKKGYDLFIYLFVAAAAVQVSSPKADNEILSTTKAYVFKSFSISAARIEVQSSCFEKKVVGQMVQKKERMAAVVSAEH